MVMRIIHRGPLPRSVGSEFAGFRFPAEAIVLAVRWYLRFGLSYRDVEEPLAERGVEVDHVTVYRWVHRFTSLLAEAARPCRHVVGDSCLSTRPTSRSAGSGVTCTERSTSLGTSPNFRAIEQIAAHCESYSP
jgi:hypothetical protein